MTLRQRAERDLARMIESTSLGFGWPVTITDPAGKVGAFTGLSDDISAVIDPDTGQVVSGRHCSAALRISTLYAAGFTLPEHVPQRGAPKWRIEFTDINGQAYVFTVREQIPDRTAGVVVLILEAFTL